jgi:hypothetical protein
MIAFWNIVLYSLTKENQHFRVTALMMEAVHIFETSVYFNETTRCYIPEGYLSIIFTLEPENSLKTQFNIMIC